MPNFIASELLVLEFNSGTSVVPVWEKLICLTEKSFSGSTATVEISTDCNANFSTPLPSKLSWSLSASGVANSTPSAGEGSYESTYQLWANKTVTEFRVRSMDNSYYREGLGFISDISEPSSAGDFLNFSATVTGSGTVKTSPTT